MFATEWVTIFLNHHDYNNDADDVQYNIDYEQVRSAGRPDKQHHRGRVGGAAHQEGCQAGHDHPTDQRNIMILSW